MTVNTNSVDWRVERFVPLFENLCGKYDKLYEINCKTYIGTDRTKQFVDVSRAKKWYQFDGKCQNILMNFNHLATIIFCFHFFV